MESESKRPRARRSAEQAGEPARNPANRTKKPSEPAASTAPDGFDAGTVVATLRESFDRGTTRGLEWRLRQLDGLLRMMQEQEDAICAALHADLRKPRVEAFAAEVAYSAAEARRLRSHVAAWMRPERVSTPLLAQPGRSSVVKEPLGVVLVIAPWNYPFQLAVSPLIGALAAGNCAVVKPSEVAPATSTLLAELLPRYLDPRCVQVVEGGVPETTRLLEQRFDHIFYTGSTAVGRVIMAAAARHLTPVTLELGGKSPCYVDNSADLAVAARRIVWGKFFNAGQTCVAPDYVLAHEAVHDALVEALVQTIRAFFGDDPQRSADYARIVSARHHRRLVALLDSGRLAAGGHSDEADRYIAPTVLTDVSPDSAVMADEIFGPILPVLRVHDVHEAIRFVNARPKPLSAYVFAARKDVQQAFIGRTSSGAIVINHVWMHMSVHELPFGGVGDSGMGAYHHKASFDTFTHHKAVLVKSTAVDPSVFYPPYSNLAETLVRRVL